MFEAKCPSCSASYQVDERRVPPTGLKMRCPKCGESFQVTTPTHSDPPILGAALGLKNSPSKTPPRHKHTMLGVPEQGGAAGGPPRPAAPPRADVKKTMMGVAPGSAGGGFELASLDDDEPAAPDADELDLTGGSGDADELDLDGGSGDVDELDLDGDGGLDLDSADDDGELDLPTPSSRESKGMISLPGDSEPPEEADLPSLGGELPDLPSPVSDDAGLPDLTSGDEAELPSPAQAGLPDIGGAGLPDLGSDLPDIEAGLPTVGGNLPEAAGSLPSLSADLPDAQEAVIGGLDPFGDGIDAFDQEGPAGPSSLDFDAPPRGSGLDLSGPPPAPDAPSGMEADDIFGQGPTQAPASVTPPAHGEGDPSAFGEVNLGDADPHPGTGDGGFATDSGEEDEFDAFPTDDSSGGSGPTSLGGGDGYGDVALDGDSGGGGGAFDLGDDVDRGPASDGPPRARGTAAATARVELPGPSDGKKKESKEEKKKRRKTSGLSKATRVGLAAALLFAVGGGALSLLPDVGPYGAYFVLDTINSDTYRSKLAADVKAAQDLLKKDTSSDVSSAFTLVDSGRAGAPRYKPRKAYAAFLGFFHQLRFGASTNVSTQAQVLLDDLKEADPNTEYLSLAQLAHQGAMGKHEAIVKSADRHIKRGHEFAALVGEVALAVGDIEASEKAWTAVLKSGPSTQGHFGMARTMQLANKPAEAKKHMDDALRLNSGHAGARLLLAKIQLRSRQFDEEIVKSLTPLSEGKGASRGEQVSALVILGDLHLTRARLKRAEASFKEALKLDSGSASAQRGLAQTLFESGRFSDALTRFEAALAKAPTDLAANLGLVQCKLRLEQLDDAVKHLSKLKKAHPKSSAVAYWEGRGRESVGEKDEAQKAYERAIEMGDDSPELVDAYISLTRLLSQKGSLEAAAEIIAQAEKRFPADPAVYEALGELSTSRGSYDEAVKDYDKALELDPSNIGLRFSRGIALRQARRFEEAAKEFDYVEKESPDYPGLALERGNLYQASGRSEEALKSYEKALAAAPEDKDLMLRVACGKAEAGQSDPAIELLKPVLEERASSAEVNFCQGLALLNKEDFAGAKLHLGRAVAQDATRAKYHLYVGWVALEMQDLGQASASLDKTIQLDRTLADAYWKRGDLRVRSGAVKDALDDIAKALELAPGRLEAHAAAARAYIQIGKEQEALAAWKKAVSAEGVEPVWRFQYGKLLFVNKQVVEAREQLEKAIAGVEKRSPEPVWLAEAHRYLAMAIGRSKDALPHWQHYLKVKAGSNEPYVAEAMREMKAIMTMAGY